VAYWFASPLPTLVVAVDIVAHQAWYAWHLDLFESPAEVFQSKQQTITIRIPKHNCLNKAGWDDIRRRLKEHFGSLLDAINEANLASRLLPAINTLARNVGNLVKLSKTPSPASSALMTEYEGMSLFIEQIEHRSVLSVVRALLEHVRPDSGAAHHIRAWLDVYEATALTAYPRLNALPAHGPYGPDLEIAFAPKQVLETRGRLIDAGLDMIQLLTARQGGRAKNDRASGTIQDRPSDSAISERGEGGLPITLASSAMTVKTVRLRVSDLGFAEGATTKEIIGAENDTNKNGTPAPFTAGRAGELGLCLCPAEVGPRYRLHYKDQPPGERLHVAMMPIASSDGEPRIFVLVHNADGLSLDAARARSDDKWQPTDIFIFCAES